MDLRQMEEAEYAKAPAVSGTSRAMAPVHAPIRALP